MELSAEESKFFESGGEAEITEEPVVEAKEEVREEVKEEKKRPSRFEYSSDTDNVTDDLGRKYIPLGAVQEARNENKKLRTELDELKSKWTGGEQKLNALLQKLEGKSDEPPAFDKDPLGNLKARNDALESEIKALKEGHGKIEEQSKASAQIQRFQSTVTTAEKQFASEHPDYVEAVGRVQEAWRAEFELAGLSDEQIEVALSRKGAQFSYAAMQKNQNPAEAVYKLAQRLGHKTQAKEESKEKDKLATIAKGQEAEKSLADGKGNVGMSLEALASMSDEEMEAFVADPKSWKKLARG